MERLAPPTGPDRLLALARERGILRARDLRGVGLAREDLRRLVRKGLLQRLARGLYVLADAKPTERRSLAEAAALVPSGVVCLLSALRFHGFTTQSPGEVYLAIDGKAHRPRLDELPLRIVRFSKELLQAGVEEHRIEGVRVRVTTPARTVADCFKYRHKIGLDVALEALREAWRADRVMMDELWRFARLCRVATVMRPYLEMLA